MKKLLLSVLFIVITLQSTYADRLLKRESRELNRLIQNEADYLSYSQIEKLRQLILEAKYIINNGNTIPDWDRQACTDKLYKLYFKSLSNQQAMDRAVQDCKTFKDLEIFTFVYNTAYKSISNVQAIELAVRNSGRDLEYKLELLKYLYATYYKSLSNIQSLEKSLNITKTLQGNEEQCIKKNYAIYYRSLSNVQALDKAIISCR